MLQIKCTTNIRRLPVAEAVPGSGGGERGQQRPHPARPPDPAHGGVRGAALQRGRAAVTLLPGTDGGRE